MNLGPAIEGSARAAPESAGMPASTIAANVSFFIAIAPFGALLRSDPVFRRGVRGSRIAGFGAKVLKTLRNDPKLFPKALSWAMASERFAFGPFQLDAARGALFEHGLPVTLGSKPL